MEKMLDFAPNYLESVTGTTKTYSELKPQLCLTHLSLPTKVKDKSSKQADYSPPPPSFLNKP